MEQVKETASSEGLQLLGTTLTYRDSLESPRSVPMQPYLGSVVLCLINTCVVGFKFTRIERRKRKRKREVGLAGKKRERKKGFPFSFQKNLIQTNSN